jgi:hypothetical protein
MIREWRAALLDQGVSVSTAPKAYRLLRAVLMTAVDEDKILSSNPCRVRGAGDEHAPERQVLTVAQVFELAERVGRRPFGNVRQVPGNRYRLRLGEMARCRRYPRSTAAGPKLPRCCGRWQEMVERITPMTRDTGRWCCWRPSLACAGGEVIALRRCDLDLDKRTVRVRVAYVERSTGEMLLGPDWAAVRLECRRRGLAYAVVGFLSDVGGADQVASSSVRTSQHFGDLSPL